MIQVPTFSLPHSFTSSLHRRPSSLLSHLNLADDLPKVNHSLFLLAKLSSFHLSPSFPPYYVDRVNFNYSSSNIAHRFRRAFLASAQGFVCSIFYSLQASNPFYLSASCPWPPHLGADLPPFPWLNHLCHISLQHM